MQFKHLHLHPATGLLVKTVGKELLCYMSWKTVYGGECMVVKLMLESAAAILGVDMLD